MAKKIEWYGSIPDEAKSWLTFSDQKDKGYEYNKYFTEITASTDDNGGSIIDTIGFNIAKNNTSQPRYATVLFRQKFDKQAYCKVTQKEASKQYRPPVIDYETLKLSVTPDGENIGWNVTSYTFTAVANYENVVYWYIDENDPKDKEHEFSRTPTSYTVTNDSNCLWTSKTSGVNVGSSKGNFTFESNTSTSAKTITVSATYTKDDHSVSADGSIIQGLSEEPQYQGDAYINSDKSYLEVTPDGGNIGYDVKEQQFNAVLHVKYARKYIIPSQGTEEKVDEDYGKNNGLNTDSGVTNDCNWEVVSSKSIDPTNISVEKGLAKFNENLNDKSTRGIYVKATYSKDGLTKSDEGNITQVTGVRTYQLEVNPVSLNWKADELNKQEFTVKSTFNNNYRFDYTIPTLTNFTCQQKTRDGVIDTYEIWPKNKNTNRLNDIVESFIVSQSNQEGVNDNGLQSQKVTLTQYAKDLIIFKSDYLRLTYSWEGDADVDTITVINSKIGVEDDNPSSPNKFSDYSVGYNRPSSDYSSSQYTIIKPYLQYGGDTRTSGQEGVLINFKNLLNYITTHSGDTTSDGTNVLDSLKTSDDKYQIEIDIYANVFSGQTTALPNVSYTSFIEKEGLTPEIVIHKDTHEIEVKNCTTPEGGEGKDEINVFSKGAPNAYKDENYPKYYTKVAVIYYDIETGICRMKTNKSGYFENGKGYKGDIELISNDNVKFYEKSAYDLTYKYFYQNIYNIKSFGSGMFPVSGGTIIFEVESKDSDGNNIDFNVKKAYTFEKDLIDFDNGITIYKPKSKDENYKVTITLGDSKIHSVSNYAFESIVFTQKGYENYSLQTRIEQLVYPSDDYKYVTMLRTEMPYIDNTLIDTCTIINNNGTFFKYQVLVQSYKYKQDEIIPVPYTFTTTIDTLSLNNKPFTPTNSSIQKHEISNSVQNNSISDVRYGITLTQEESNKTENKPKMIMQLGTYTFKVSSGEETKNTYLASVLSVSSDGLSKEVKFNVASKDDKGNNAGFKLSYNTENGYVSATTNEIDEVTVNCKSNTVNQEKTFVLTLTQNISDNKRYIVIVLSGKTVSSSSKENDGSE